MLIFAWSLLEGMGAALIMPAIVALVATNFAAPERPKAYGLAGAVLISVLTSSFFSGIAANEAIPPPVTSQAHVDLASGIPFVSDAQLESALAETDLDPAAQAAIVDENAQSRLAGLRSALAVLALLALVAFFTSGGPPTRQPGSPEPDRPEQVAAPAAELALSPPGAL